MSDLINMARNCLKCQKAPCTLNCPIHNQIPQIFKHYEMQEYEIAYQLLINNNPLFMLCGMTCDHYDGCAKNCNYLKIHHERLAFELVEQDLLMRFGISFDFPKITKDQVLIVGAGPAGLMSAISFRKQGYNTTVIDLNNGIGGVINTLIPNFRFDMNILNELENILKKDIHFIFNQDFNNIDKQRLKQYRHIIIATGTPLPIKQLNGNDVFDGLTILAQIKKNEFNLPPKRIGVLGLGNVAIDCARSLKRLGHNVSIIYRRDLNNAKAAVEELEVLKDEQITVHELLSALSFENKKATFAKMKLGDADESGRRSFIKTDETIQYSFDYLVEAYGSKPKLPLIDDDFNDYLDHGYPVINNYQNYYFCGDCFTGPSTIVKAISDAKKLTKQIIQNDEIIDKINNLNKSIYYGGSFNPWTKAHKQIYNYLLAYLKQDVIIIPNGNNYYAKELEHYDLRKLLIKTDLENALISDELKDQFSGTVHFLREHQHPLFVLGSDSIKTINTWIDYQTLVKENVFICFNRGDYDLKTYILNDSFLRGYIDHFLIINLAIFDVSATSFRSIHDERIVTKKVLNKINECNLYK